MTGLLPLVCLAPLLFTPTDHLRGTYSRGDGYEQCGYVMSGQTILHYDPEVRHVHNVKRNPYDGCIYASMGDQFPNKPNTKGKSKLKVSCDGGKSWDVIAQHSRANYLTIDFAYDLVYLGEDSAQQSPSSRIVRYNPEDGKRKTIFTLPKGYEANIWSSYQIGDIVFYGTLTDKVGARPIVFFMRNEKIVVIKKYPPAKKPWVGVRDDELKKVVSEFLSRK